MMEPYFLAFLSFYIISKGKIYNTHCVYYKNFIIHCDVCYDRMVNVMEVCILKMIKNSVLCIIVVNIMTFFL